MVGYLRIWMMANPILWCFPYDAKTATSFLGAENRDSAGVPIALD